MRAVSAAVSGAHTSHSPFPGAVSPLLPTTELQALLEGLPATQEDGPVNIPAKQQFAQFYPVYSLKKNKHGVPLKNM